MPGNSNRGNPHETHPAVGRIPEDLADRLPDHVRERFPINRAPEVALIPVVEEIPEDADTAARIKIADILVIDDGFGINRLTLAGADAGFFEIVDGALYLKAGVDLDFETKSRYDVTVRVDDPALGDGPDDSSDFTLAIGDVPEGPPEIDAFAASQDSGVANQFLENDGAGNLTPHDAGGPNMRSNGVALGDVDGDGDLDAIVANVNGADQLYLNNGDGTFAVSDLPAAGTDTSFEVAFGDLDGDGDLDALIAKNGTNEMLTNDGAGNFIASAIAGGSLLTLHMAVADVDGDGDLDALAANSGTNQLLTNDGAGNFTATALPGGAAISSAIAVGDLDGDGDLDAMVANVTGPGQVLTNDGDGNFTAAPLAGSALNLVDFALGDLDGDGDLDGVGITSTGLVQIFENDGTGGLALADVIDTGVSSSGLAIGDLDRDEDLDILLAQNFADGSGMDQAEMLVNDGDGNFTRANSHLILTSPTDIALGDLDNDGFPVVDQYGLPVVGPDALLPDIYPELAGLI